MKTFNQHSLNQSSISIEDIIFEGRNQQYGAFVLRKTSNKRILQAFFITFLFIAPLFILKIFNKSKLVPQDREIVIATLPVEKINKNTFTPPPPPPPIQNQLLNTLKANILAVPLVVDSVTNYQDPELPAYPVSPVDPGSLPKVQYIDTGTYEPDIIDTRKPYLKVEEEASFKGGTLNDFRIWVSKNIKYPDSAAEMEIQGKVVIQFVIGTGGKTEDIVILKGIDDLLDKEASRVIATSPEWKPARQQGNVVRQQFVIPIQFQLNKRN